jgi:two-component system nitrate/nitrite sensor histidine kinase NarX
VRESYADVRELLVHFRTRANAEDIEPALQTTLRKFEHQTGIRPRSHGGQWLPLAPDLQIQVLHIVQEALSNVRKHAGASQVWLDVQQQPLLALRSARQRRGFDSADDGTVDETHVGLRIMRERAQRIGATLEVFSAAWARHLGRADAARRGTGRHPSPSVAAAVRHAEDVAS